MNKANFTNFDDEEITKDEAINDQIKILIDMSILSPRVCLSRIKNEEVIREVLSSCSNNSEIDAKLFGLKRDQISLQNWIIKYKPVINMNNVDQRVNARWAAISAGRKNIGGS